MNSAEKVYKLVTDKDFKMASFARKTGIPFNTLRQYRQGVNQVKKAQWFRVEQLASVYDQLQATKLNKDNKQY